MSKIGNLIFKIACLKLNEYHESRLRKSIFEKGCEVLIRGREIHYIDEDPDRSKKTVDIAGYNADTSEFYEIKVGPNNFTDNIIKYLNILNLKACDENISKKITVGCMTMDTKANLKQNLNKVRILDKVDYTGLKIMSRDEVKQIINNK